MIHNDYEIILKSTFKETGVTRRTLSAFGFPFHDFIKVRASGEIFGSISCHTKNLVAEALCPDLKRLKCFDDRIWVRTFTLQPLSTNAKQSAWIVPINSRALPPRALTAETALNTHAEGARIYLSSFIMSEESMTWNTLKTDRLKILLMLVFVLLRYRRPCVCNTPSER